MKDFKIITALAKATFKRFLRDPTTLFFTIFFPLLFLLIFGAIFGGESNFSAEVAYFDNANSEHSQQLEKKMEELGLKTQYYESYEAAEEDLDRSQIDLIVKVDESYGQPNKNNLPSGEVEIEYLESRSQDAQSITAVINRIIHSFNLEVAPYEGPFSVVATPLSQAALTSLDYLIPGILGFSIMAVAIFGMANGFAEDKSTGAIARLRIAPIRSYHIIISTGMVFISMGMVSVSLIMATAIMLFDFQMAGSYLDLIPFLIISIVSLFGVGCIIGGWAKNDKQALPLAQLIGMPMMFLSGSFFPVFLMPDWLQSVTRFVPLTHINDGIRLIAAENYSIFDLGQQILILGCVGMVAYVVAFLVFRWE